MVSVPSMASNHMAQQLGTHTGVLTGWLHRMPRVQAGIPILATVRSKGSVKLRGNLIAKEVSMPTTAKVLAVGTMILSWAITATWLGASAVDVVLLAHS
jgi:hypothetical protein